MIDWISDRESRSLSRMGVKSTADLLFWMPRWHVCRKRITPIADAHEGDRGFFLARIARVNIFKRGRLHIIKVQLDDGTGRAYLYWFNRPYLASDYKVDRTLAICDVPQRTSAGVRFSGSAGTCELVTEDEVRRIEADEIVTFYRSTTVIDQARARAIIAGAMERGLGSLVDPIPESVRDKFDLIPLAEAVRGVHAPASWDAWEKARRRIVFDQLYFLQLGLGLGRIQQLRVKKGRTYSVDGGRMENVMANLPFSLTGAQRRVQAEVIEDLSREYPMNRLLQGDVGSGKTVVAAVAAAVAVDSGYQVAIMAPTEILVEQHFHTFRRLLGPAGVRVAMLTSGQTKAQKRQVHAGLTGGYFDLVVGTHSLIEPDVAIPRLGFIVIDERHKFGVRQRAKLEAKGRNPDLLMMTATPLPRAMVLTRYGDTSLSTLDEMPPGRGTISTKWIIGAGQRSDAYRFIAGRLAEGEKAFAVFPLVEESEHLLLRNATKEFERLKRAFPKFSLGLIHGKMSSSEKEEAMRAFSDGRTAFLVATTVVEVGIDMPDATVMLIEHANRFGLAQLHQLRGRVGRGSRPSWCFLVTSGQLTSDARQRLNAMVKTTNGFELAETDLALRGPGELFGTRQHGVLDVEYLDLLSDVRELAAARGEVEAFLKQDPDLVSPEGKKLESAFKSRLADTWDLIRAS